MRLKNEKTLTFVIRSMGTKEVRILYARQLVKVRLRGGEEVSTKRKSGNYINTKAVGGVTIPVCQRFFGVPILFGCCWIKKG